MEYTLVSGSHAAQGRRDTMEDAHVHIDDVLSMREGIANFHQVAFYGVYDGHGGTTAAEMVERLLHGNIFGSDHFRTSDVPNAITEGFTTTDKTIVEAANREGWMNGSTAVAAVVADGELFVGNIGDSEAVLVSVDDQGALQCTNLTTPHKASDQKEKERIEALGGHVFFGRVFGALAVSRAFGDSRYKQPKTSQDFVTADPAHHRVKLEPQHKFLILACDGLWDVMSHEEAASSVFAGYQEGKGPADVASVLVSEALRKRTEDNVSVIVVYISWSSEGSSSESDDDDATPETEVQAPDDE